MCHSQKFRVTQISRRALAPVEPDASRDYSWTPPGGSRLPRCNPQRKRGRTVTTPSLTLRVTFEP